MCPLAKLVGHCPAVTVKGKWGGGLLAAGGWPPLHQSNSNVQVHLCLLLLQQFELSSQRSKLGLITIVGEAAGTEARQHQAAELRSERQGTSKK